MDGMGISILVMGRLATRDMNAGSDLDMITVYSGGDGADGYYAKLTRLLITFLSAQMAHGRLYDVDMRLRPSGRAGPVASSLAAFKDYHETQAWVWEHLALCRMKPLGGAGELHRAIEDIRRDIIASPRDMAEVKLRIKEMLATVARTASGGGERSVREEMRGRVVRDFPAGAGIGSAGGWRVADCYCRSVAPRGGGRFDNDRRGG